MVGALNTVAKIVLLIKCFKHVESYKRFIPHNFSSTITIQESKIEDYKLKSKALKKLYDRKLIHYVSDIRNVDMILYQNENEKDWENKKSAYAGIDLNCKYLHIGNLIPLITLDILRNYNTDVILLLGRSTTKIGDPSFQNVERKKTLEKEIYENEKNIRSNIISLLLQNELDKKDLRQIIEKSHTLGEKKFVYKSTSNKGSLTILTNTMWYGKMNLIDFLQYGEHFSVNKLLRKECFQSKLRKKNLTLKDLNYITLQSFDFVNLFRKYNTFIQIGGSDQWGNIQSGIELCHNVFNTQLYGLTTNLLIHRNNVKYSKSLFNENRKLPIWIDKKYNPPFLFWTFLRNVDDQRVQSYVDMLTDLNINIHERVKMKAQGGSPNEETMLEHGKKGTLEHTHSNESVSSPPDVEKIYDAEINRAKKKLADRVTSFIYGSTVVEQIHKMIEIMKLNEFSKIDNVSILKIFPHIQISINNVREKKMNIMNLLRKFEIAITNKEAKEKIGQRCVYLNTHCIDDPKRVLSMEDFIHMESNLYFSILRMGKKRCYSIIAK
ncbi:tyrosine--tRNA ligase, putative [Plasmodium ovale]|uniref:Tyrosine--tRNA ligase n=2 Tax=Plasmodium ovale TaxID=36330 RepID=A0A1A8WDB0_PLAOA|nr:tyrosine--tRNA ligase, putative [Plasmodium ovale curtisi]SCP04502.1 tyrosine--tRNA ligase, putative [Plasmodium ovale]